MLSHRVVELALIVTVIPGAGLLDLGAAADWLMTGSLARWFPAPCSGRAGRPRHRLVFAT